jgi:opacity protein-like surface antigen
MVRKLCVVLAAALLSVPFTAQAAGWYAGISGGQSKTSRDLVTNRESTITLGSDFHTQFDDKDNAWKAFAGYRLNPILAVELNYADLGKHTLVTSLAGGDPPQPAAIAIERKVSGFGADLLVSAPLGPRVSMFGRAGAFRTDLKATASLSGNIVFTNGAPGETSRSTKQHETVFRYGVGADLALWRNGGLRLEWERYNKIGKAFCVGCSGTTGEADTDVVSIGAVFHF